MMVLKTLILCLLLMWKFGLVHADEEELVLEDASLQHGKSVIIELEEESADAKEESGLQPVKNSAEKKKKSGKRQVELIIGGQGEDGVAKRGKLIIDD